MKAGRRSRAVTVTGRTEVVKRVNALMAAMTDEEKHGARGSVMDVLGQAASIVAAAMRTMARLKGYPAAVIESVFYRQQLPASLRARKKPAALAGVSKRESMVQWTATKSPASPRARVPAGSEVAMSLAAMYEFGTSRMAGRGAIQDAVTSSRGAVREAIRNGLAGVIRENTAS